MSAIVHIRHPDITYQPKSSLTAAASATATSLSLGNTNGFTASKYLLIGGYKSPKAEIKLGGAITNATTLATAATSFDHVPGEVVSQIPYNQVEIDYSTNMATLWDTGLYASLADAMAAATWSNLTTTSITPAQEETTYKDDSTATRSYRWRYKNSTDTIYSDYINILLPTGEDMKQVSAIIRMATNRLNKKPDSSGTGQVNLQFCFDEINQCAIWVDKKKNKWPHNRQSNNVFAEITAGTNTYILPSNIASRESKQSVENVKINQYYNLIYKDKQEMDVLTVSTKTSALAVALTSASSTATFDDTSDFADSGTFDVWVSGVKMTVTYTANNRTTNVLTTPNTATEVTATAAIDSPVWQNAQYGVPTYYTIYDGAITFDVVPNETIHQRTISGDYFLKTQFINSEDDYVRTDNPNIFIDWLRYAISDKTNNNTRANEYKADRNSGLEDMQGTAQTGQRQFLKPPRSIFGLRRRYYGTWNRTNRDITQ